MSAIHTYLKDHRWVSRHPFAKTLKAAALASSERNIFLNPPIKTPIVTVLIACFDSPKHVTQRIGVAIPKHDEAYTEHAEYIIDQTFCTFQDGAIQSIPEMLKSLINGCSIQLLQNRAVQRSHMGLDTYSLLMGYVLSVMFKGKDKFLISLSHRDDTYYLDDICPITASDYCPRLS